jgi:hypothetical protein
LALDNGKPFVGSRVTIYHTEDAWKIQGPLILMSIVDGANSILGAIGSALDGEVSDHAVESAWKEADFEQIATHASRCGDCSVSRSGITAAFQLRPEATIALAEDRCTAAWTVNNDAPHPYLGGGLLCVLEMPHRVSSESRLTDILAKLNSIEMQPCHLPPNFGAWCPGDSGNNLAFVSFLPNQLHEAAPAIAVNMTVWAWVRAQLANRTLESMGVSAG